MPSHQIRVRQNYCEHEYELHYNLINLWWICIKCEHKKEAKKEDFKFVSPGQIVNYKPDAKLR